MWFSAGFWIAFTLSAIAGIVDLLTTEIPDEIPLLMASIGVFLWFMHGLWTGSWHPLVQGLIEALVLFVLGWALFKTGSWGAGDWLVLSAIPLLVPYVPGSSMFLARLLLSVIFVGGAWSLSYAIALFAARKNISREFVSRMRKHAMTFFLLSLLIWLFTARIDGQLSFMLSFSVFIGYVAWEFGKTVEDVGFVREIDASLIKEGDVLYDSKQWIGLTKEQAEKISKKGGKVKIKEGVRFGPVFPLALLALRLFA